MTAHGSTRIKEIFAQAQYSVAAHKKLVNELKKLHDKLPNEVFFKTFTECLRVPLMCGEKAPPTERTLDFAVNFVTSFTKKKAVTENEGTNDGESDEEDETPKFVTDTFKFMCESACAEDQTVRFRICQFINKLLNGLGNEACMDDDLCDLLCDRMLERLKDKSPLVRSQAIRALYRLQDPMDAECRVTSAYIFHFSSDPSSDVRATALTNIAISSHSVRAILERSQDTNETVRKIAFSRLAEMNIQRFSIEMRVRLLERGLKDSSDKVRKAATNDLLRSWFDFHKGSFVSFLLALDSEHSTETSTLALETMFQSFKTGLTSAIDQIRNLQGSDKLIPVEELSAENVLLWKVLVVYLEKHPEIAEERPIDEPLEDLVPELSTFCTYILKYFDQPVPDDDSYVLILREYILRQLLEMCDTFDLSDEMGRSNLRSTSQTLLLHNGVSNRVVPTLVKILVKVIPNVDDRLQFLAEVIAELHDPSADSEEALQPPTIQMSAEEKRQLEIKEAKIKMKLNEMTEDQDEAVKAKDFIRAQQLQDECQKLREELKALTAPPPPPPPPVEKPVTQEARSEVLIIKDRSKLQKCLCIVKEMMQHASVLSLTPTLRSLMHNFVMPCLQQQTDDPVIKNMALEAMGLFCLLDRDSAKEHFVYMFCFQIANDEVCETALKVTFDLLHLYGLETFEVEENKTDDPLKKRPKKKKNLFVTDATEDEFEEDEDDTQSQTVNSSNANTANLIGMLTSLLSSASTTMRNLAMKGLCKLLLACRMTSSALLSRLIVMWYSPVTDGDEEFRQPLATFLGALSTICPRGQEMLEQAFLPTIRTIRYAPADSPISEVDLESVIKLFLSLTRPGKNKYHKKQNTHVHNAFAVTLCNEILNQDDRYADDGILLKSLLQLELCLDDPVYRQDLQNFIGLMKEAYTIRKEKGMYKYVEKFEKMVQNSVPEAPAACSDVDNTTQAGQLNNVDNTVQTEQLNNVDNTRRTDLFSADNTTQSNLLNGTSVVKKSRKNAKILKTGEEIADNSDDDNASIDSITFGRSGLPDGTVIPESPPAHETTPEMTEFDPLDDLEGAGPQHSKRRRISEDKTTKAVSPPKKTLSSAGKSASKSNSATSKEGRPMSDKEVSPPRTPKKTAESTKGASSRRGAGIAAKVVEPTEPAAIQKGAATRKGAAATKGTTEGRQRGSSQEDETSWGKTDQRESRSKRRTGDSAAEPTKKKVAVSQNRESKEGRNTVEPTKRKAANKRVDQRRGSPAKSLSSQDSFEDEAEPTKRKAVDKRTNARKESPVKSKNGQDKTRSGNASKDLDEELSDVRPRREVKLTAKALAYKEDLSKRTTSVDKGGESLIRSPPTPKGSASSQTPKRREETPKTSAEEDPTSAAEWSADSSGFLTPVKRTRSNRHSELDSTEKSEIKQKKVHANNQEPSSKANDATSQSSSPAKQKAAPVKNQKTSSKAKEATSSEEKSSQNSSPTRPVRTRSKISTTGESLSTTSSPATQMRSIRSARNEEGSGELKKATRFRSFSVDLKKKLVQSSSSQSSQNSVVTSDRASRAKTRLDRPAKASAVRKGAAQKRATKKVVVNSSSDEASSSERPPLRSKALTQQSSSSDSPMPASSSSGATSKSNIQSSFTKITIPTSSSDDSSEPETAARSAGRMKSRGKAVKATSPSATATWHLPTQSEILQRAVERVRSGVMSEGPSTSKNITASSLRSPSQENIIELAVDRLRRSVVFSHESSSASNSPVYRILPTSNSSPRSSPSKRKSSVSSQEKKSTRTPTRATSKESPARSTDKTSFKKTPVPADQKTPAKQTKSSSDSSSPSRTASVSKSSGKPKAKTSLGRLSSSSTSSPSMSTRSQDFPNKLRARKRV